MPTDTHGQERRILATIGLTQPWQIEPWHIGRQLLSLDLTGKTIT